MRNTRDEQSVAVASQLRRRSKETVVALMPPTLRPKHPTAAERIEARIGGVLSDMQTQFVSLVKAYDRRMRRWRARFWFVVVAITVGGLLVVLAYVVSHNFDLRYAVKVTAFDRDTARAEAACHDQLRRRVIRTRHDIMTPLEERLWVNRCILSRLTAEGSKT